MQWIGKHWTLGNKRQQFLRDKKKMRWILQLNQHNVQSVFLATTSILSSVFSLHWGNVLENLRRPKQWVFVGVSTQREQYPERTFRTAKDPLSGPELSSAQSIHVRKMHRSHKNTSTNKQTNKQKTKITKGGSQCFARHIWKFFNLSTEMGLFALKIRTSKLPGPPVSTPQCWAHRH